MGISCILTAFSKHPEATNQRIAREVGTRTIVVARFLDSWRTSGECALNQFGRPRVVSATVLSELKGKLESQSLCSLGEVTDWLADRKRVGVGFSRPIVHGYCRELGFDLPSQRRRPKKTAGRRRRYQWTEQQIGELKSYPSSLGQRATALLNIGTEQKTIREVAHECGVNY